MNASIKAFYYPNRPGKDIILTNSYNHVVIFKNKRSQRPNMVHDNEITIRHNTDRYENTPHNHTSNIMLL